LDTSNMPISSQKKVHLMIKRTRLAQMCGGHVVTGNLVYFVIDWIDFLMCYNETYKIGQVNN